MLQGLSPGVVLLGNIVPAVDLAEPFKFAILERTDNSKFSMDKTTMELRLTFHFLRSYSRLHSPISVSNLFQLLQTQSMESTPEKEANRVGAIERWILGLFPTYLHSLNIAIFLQSSRLDFGKPILR